jgi:hypothetical protein
MFQLDGPPQAASDGITRRTVVSLMGTGASLLRGGATRAERGRGDQLRRILTEPTGQFARANSHREKKRGHPQSEGRDEAVGGPCSLPESR